MTEWRLVDPGLGHMLFQGFFPDSVRKLCHHVLLSPLAHSSRAGLRGPLLTHVSRYRTAPRQSRCYFPLETTIPRMPPFSCSLVLLYRRQPITRRRNLYQIYQWKRQKLRLFHQRLVQSGLTWKALASLLPAAGEVRFTSGVSRAPSALFC